MIEFKQLPVSRKKIIPNMENATAIAKASMRKSAYYQAAGGTPFFVLSSIVSSPRLFDVFWKDVATDAFVKAGDSFLEQYTMLCDNHQKTYAISWNEWQKLDGTYATVDEYDINDTSISKIQVWPYDPRTLTFKQMVLSVGVSFTDEELQEEPRLCGALRELMKDFQVEYYWVPRVYG